MSADKLNGSSVGSAIEQMVSWSFERNISRPARYSIVALVILTVAAFRIAFVTDLLPWLLFIPAILALALLLGEGPGAFATLLSAGLAGYSIGGSPNPFWLNANQWFATFLFVFVNLGIAALAGELRVTLRRKIEAEVQQQLLIGELGHRLKNVLTIVQSIAGQTFRDADSVEAASSGFASRLASLGKATDVLTAGGWHRATLADVIEAGLTSVSGYADRISVEGPLIELSSQVALALTLAIHELATNAVKYGALSDAGGEVTIRWRVSGEGSDARFGFLWKERGGPRVLPPQRRGFGSRMIERSLRAYFGGEAELKFLETGVEFRIEAPMPSIA